MADWLIIALSWLALAVVVGGLRAWSTRERTAPGEAIDRLPELELETLHLEQGANFVGTVEIARFATMRRRLGYDVSNRVVAMLSDRMQHDSRCHVRRLGRTSIEFTYTAADARDAHALVEALRRYLEAPLTIEGLTIEPEIFIGSSAVRDNKLDDEVFDLSAAAVEDARLTPSRTSFARKDGAGPQRSLSIDLLRDLQNAIRSDGLDLHYMPKLDLRDGTIHTVEALCRWTHPERGSISPAAFIALAEETGLIADLTMWTFDRAIRDQQIVAAGGLDIAIDINLSGLLVGNADYCDQLIARLAGASGRIGIEITETATIEDQAAALANITRLADAGLRIAIDDFGSGLSSLAYLRELPAHELKIDQSFIRALATSNRDPLLVRSAIDIAHALEMEVTAEGVEDEVSLALLKVMRCDHVQGYHISRPLPVDRLIEYLSKPAREVPEERPVDQASAAMAGTRFTLRS